MEVAEPGGSPPRSRWNWPDLELPRSVAVPLAVPGTSGALSSPCPKDEADAPWHGGESEGSTRLGLDHNVPSRGTARSPRKSPAPAQSSTPVPRSECADISPACWSGAVGSLSSPAAIVAAVSAWTSVFLRPTATDDFCGDGRDVLDAGGGNVGDDRPADIDCDIEVRDGDTIADEVSGGALLDVIADDIGGGVHDVEDDFVLLRPPSSQSRGSSLSTTAPPVGCLTPTKHRDVSSVTGARSRQSPSPPPSSALAALLVSMSPVLRFKTRRLVACLHTSPPTIGPTARICARPWGASPPMASGPAAAGSAAGGGSGACKGTVMVTLTVMVMVGIFDGGDGDDKVLFGTLRRNSEARLPFSTAGFFFVAGVDLLAADLFCMVLLAAGLFLTSLVVS